MQLVCSGFHGNVVESASRLSILRGVVAGLDGKFFDGIHAGLILLRLAEAHVVGAILAFNADGLGVGGRPAHAYPTSFCKVGPRDQKRYRVRITQSSRERHNGQVAQPITLDVLTQFSAFCSKQRCIGAYGDRLANIPNFELDIDAQCLRNHYCDAGLHKLLESGYRGR